MSKNAKVDIWMPLSIGDYLADTSHLNTTQHGAYLLMLMHYWRKGPLPNDSAVLANITKLSADAWSIHQAVLMQFYFVGEDGLLHQKRADREREEALEKKAGAKEKAVKAAGIRWKNAPSNAPGIPPSTPPSNAPSTPQAMLGSCPLPLPSEEANTPPTARETIDHFEGMELQIANDLFREFRIPAEATLTRIAGQALVFECDRLGGAEKALNSMRVAMKVAKARGDTINRFWFQDQKYDTSKVAEVKDAINKRTSPASDRVNGGLAELAEVRRRAGFGPNARADGPTVSPSGPEAIAGGLLPGLHRAGAEIWDRGSPPGAARVPRDAGPEILPPAK